MKSICKTAEGLYRTRRAITGQELISFATDLISEGFQRLGTLGSPQETRQFLTLQLAPEEREIFAVIFLDSQHRALSYEPMFQGTLDSASVHPREVVKRCLQLNAGAVILAHNHPSGSPEPSSADRHITERLRHALDLIGVRVLDHMVIGGAQIASFAERGWL